MAATPPKKSAPVKSMKKRGVAGLFVGLFMAIGAIVFLPTTLIVVIGMLPTAVAYFADTSREKALGTTVLFLNFAGVLPSLLKLWREGNIVSNALGILMEPYMLLIVLMPAAFAWMLYAYVPIIIASIVRRNAEARIRSFEKEQEYLIEQWGNSLAGPVPASQVKALPAPTDEDSTLA